MFDSIKTEFSYDKKGESLISFPTNYVVLDLETTGLDYTYCDIIEIGCLKVTNGSVSDSFSSLVNPGYNIPDYITDLTGITNEMLASAPSAEDVFPQALAFIGDNIVVAHNAHFDINFMYQQTKNYIGHDFTNNFVDTLRLCRRMLPELKHHRLCDMVEHFNIPVSQAHRSLADCYSTFSLFNKLYEIADSTGDIESYLSQFRKKHRKHYDFSQISAITTEFDPSNPFYGKTCAFTGKLDRMTREEAAQIIVNLGGICEKSTVTRNTNYLILGDNDYHKNIKGEKSDKQKKAETYMLKGFDIQIIPESVFYNLVFDE